MATEKPAPGKTLQDEPDSYDAMTSVFDTLVMPEPSAPSPLDPPTEKVDPEGGEKPPTVEEPTTSSEVTPPVTDPPAAVTAPLTEEPTPPSVVAPLLEETDWKKRAEDLEAALAASKAAPPEPVKAVEPEPKPAEPPLYTEEEQTFLTDYEKQWPDITRAESLKRRAEYRQLVGHVFSEVARVWGPLLERSEVAADAVAETTALGVIRETHDDYDTAMYHEVQAWVGGLQGMRKKMAEAIITEGEPEEVVELITEFKSATGRSKPRIVADAGGAKPPASASTTVTELSAAAKKAASAMGVVDSKRTATVTAADPNDFEGAWNEAVGSK